jgi:hypothetical protein
MSRATKVSETPKRRAMRAEWSMKRSAPFWKTKRPATKEQLLKAMLSQSNSIAVCDTHGGRFRRTSRGLLYRASVWKPQALDCFAILIVQGSFGCRRKFLLISYFRPFLKSYSSRKVRGWLRVPAGCFMNPVNDVIPTSFETTPQLSPALFFALRLFKAKPRGISLTKSIISTCLLDSYVETLRYHQRFALELHLPQFQMLTSICILDSDIHCWGRRTPRCHSNHETD